MDILVVRLQSDNSTKTTMNHDFYTITGETEKEYTVDLALRNLFVNNKKVIPKTEVNKIKYVEVFSRIDEKEYWFIDAYVYIIVSSETGSEEIASFWKEKLQIAAKAYIRERNKALKELFYSIDNVD